MKRDKSNQINRRKFIYQTGVGIALFNILPGCMTQPGRKISHNDKLNVAGIGIGGRGGADIDEVAGNGENFVALCDVDENHAAKKFAKYPEARRFTD